MFTKYVKSFQDQRMFKTFVLDSFFVLISFLLLSWFGKTLQAKSLALSGGKTAEEFQQMLLAGSLENSQAVLASLKSFLFFTLVGGILILIFLFLFYSLTTSLIWNYLQGKKLTRKNYWRWNWLNLLILVLLIPYLFLFLLLKVAITALTTTPYALHGVMLIFLIFFFFQLFRIYDNFALHYRVWEAVGKSFQKFKGKVFLFILATFFILNLVFILLKISDPNIYFIISLVAFLLFLSWMRVYLLKESSNCLPF